MPLFQVKSYNKQGSTMLELIVMMAIMAIGISSMLGVVETGSDFARDTEDTIKAINLAREGIEGVTNLRNTNWQRFSSDKINCWKVLNYNSNCIGGVAVVPTLSNGSYKLYSQNGLWYLSGITTTFPDTYGTDWVNYRQAYASWLDNRGFFTQTGMTTATGCTNDQPVNCITKFTREVTVNTQGTGSMLIKSIVRWKGLKRNREIILDATLTNWKSKF